jgi:hypothetical protein
MTAKWEGLRPGDLVEVRPPDEIARTLDGEAALDHLPFMPEMLEFYGQRLRVARRALKVCYSGAGSPGRFHADNVVTLDGVRCSGMAHDGCPKACTIFWREAWLQKADHGSVPQVDLRAIEALRSRLKVSTAAKTYYCQASELPKATRPLSRWGKITRYARGILVGNISSRDIAKSISLYLFWSYRKKLLGMYPRGKSKVTPSETLNLQPGEWVEVKLFKNILQTLDEQGKNNGLWFSPDMRFMCGRKVRVERRLDKIIVDGTGQMRKLKNTVTLEGATCGCAYLGMGTAGCSRCEFTYWREIWLRRCNEPEGERVQATASRDDTDRDL